MKPLRRLSVVDQTEAHLREGLLSGRWREVLPAERRLAVELGVGRSTLRGALLRLETEGLLAAGEGSAGRVIVSIPAGKSRVRRSLRVGVMMAIPPELRTDVMRSEVGTLLFFLQTAGHIGLPVDFPAPGESGGNGRLARRVKAAAADAWIVCLGSGEVLAWFASLPVPVLAMGGRPEKLPIASLGSDHVPAVRQAVRELVAKGHRGIVFIGPRVSRRPVPGLRVRAFLSELEAAGIRHGSFNTPDWEETPAGLESLMESLFRVTPPTALIFAGASQAQGALGFLIRRGIRVPEDVSVIVLEDADAFHWLLPGTVTAHCAEPADTVFARHAMRWVESVALGKPGRSMRNLPTRLIPGDTIAPAKPAA